METAFRTLVEEYFSKNMTLEKVNEIINEVYKPTTTKKSVEVVVEKTTTKKEKNSNVTRFSAVMLKQLKVDLIKVGVTFNDDKELENFKKECTKYLNSMDKETYLTKKIEKHITDFANTKKVESSEEETSKTKKINIESSSNIGETSNVESNIIQVTLQELQANKNLIAVDTKGPQSTFWDFEKGQYVTGPDSDSEDEDTVVKKDGKTYYVNKKSGRVYEQGVGDDEDKFVGFVGVGKFEQLLKK